MCLVNFSVVDFSEEMTLQGSAFYFKLEITKL